MAERVEWVPASSPVFVILPGETHQVGALSTPENYGIYLTTGSGAVVIEGTPMELETFGADLALQLEGISVHADR